MYPALQKIIGDNCTEINSNSFDFWVLVAALMSGSVATTVAYEEVQSPIRGGKKESKVGIQQHYPNASTASKKSGVMGDRTERLFSDNPKLHQELHGMTITSWEKEVQPVYEFIDNEGGEAPLEGEIPDMTSSTELYVNLQKIYQAKAEADCLVIKTYAKNLLKKIGRDPDSISKTTIKSLCKNARKIKEDHSHHTCLA
ncbi:hypothetical protein OROGR_000213 [Orobanche gracilis]